MDEQILMSRAALTVSMAVVSLFSILFLAANNWQKNRWLILIFFVHLWIGLSYMLSSHVYDWVKDSSFVFNLSSLLLFFPALYFYTQDLVTPNNITFSQRLPHFIPFGLLYIVIAILGRDNPTGVYHMNDNDYYLLPILLITNTIISLFYSYYIFRLIAQNQEKYQHNFSNTNPLLNLDWIKWMIYFIIGMQLFGSFYGLISDLSMNETPFLISLASILVAILILAFFAFQQPILYRGELLELEQLRAKTIAQKKAVEKIATPKKTEETTSLNISETEKKAYINQIETYFQETQPYLNPKIRMPELARSLHIPRHIFSYLINEHYQMNFFQWINQYRVNYAKELLVAEETQYYTIETIGKMAGFNSQVTFNRRFKELVGKSPKQFQKEGVKG